MQHAMRSALVLLLWWGWLPCWAQTSVTATVVDRSEEPKTVQFDGTVSFVEEWEGSQLVTSCSRQVTAKNVSGKPVVLLIAALDTRGPLGGCNAHSVIQFENFFSVPMAPEASVDGWHNAAPERSVTCCHNPLDKPDEPAAEAHVIFVQFSDGSAAGDADAAKEILKTRSDIHDELLLLAETYKNSGAQAFLDLLRKKLPEQADWYFNSFRKAAEKDGPAAAIAAVRKALDAAQRNSGLVGKGGVAQ
jgi:hypothetical protein